MYGENEARTMILEASIAEATTIQGKLDTFTRDFEMAIEAKQIAYQRSKEAASNYADAESEFTLDVMYSEEYARGKNAEARKAVLDVALIKARQPGGPLHAAWQSKARSEQVLFDAELAYMQAEARFKAIRSASYLQANTLHAVSMA